MKYKAKSYTISPQLFAFQHMPKFQYSAINQQNKNLGGIINADSQDQARQKLKSLKLTIIDIQQIDDKIEFGNEKSKYKFEARNKENKKVIGSIEADSILAAFKRLINEYELEVSKLSDLNATDAEFETSIPLVRGFYKQVKQLKYNLENDHSDEEYFKEKKQEDFRKTLEDITIILNTILNEYHDDLNPKSRDFLTKYTEHLTKIKFSKNYDSVIASASKVLKYFQDTTLYLDNQKNAEDKLDFKLDLMQKIGKLKKIGKSNNIKNNFSKTLENIGLDMPVRKKSSGILGKIIDELNIIFNSKSSNLTKRLAFKDALHNIKSEIVNIFSSLVKKAPNNPKDLKHHKLSHFQNTQVEKDLQLLSFILLSFYLSFYFLSIFLSEKISKIHFGQIFYIYQENFLIYFIIGVIFLHSAISLRFYMNKHKIQHSMLTYPVFGVLLSLIIINL